MRRSVLVALGEHFAAEGDHHVARFGEPGVLHQHENLELAIVVDEAMNRTRREPDERTGLERRFPKSLRAERLYPAAPGDDPIGLGAREMDVGCAAPQTVRCFSLVDAQVRRPDRTRERGQIAHASFASGNAEGSLMPRSPPAAASSSSQRSPA